MPKSINTPSNAQNAATNAPTPFKAGISVLAPSLSPKPFMLLNDPHGLRDLLAISFEGSYFYFDKDGYFVRSDSTETDDFQPALFHDTPANRQAIATLLAVDVTTPAPLVIDTTDDNDDEVIILSSHQLSNMACDTQGAINVIADLGRLLALIYYKKIDSATAISMARLAYEAANTWEDILRTQLEMINEPLAMTGYGKEGE